MRNIKHTAHSIYLVEIIARSDEVSQQVRDGRRDAQL